jgi:hypothetical protein
MLLQLVQLLHATPTAAAAVCVPHWPGAHWFRMLMDMSSQMVTSPPGSLCRISFDAPQQLETWGVAIFLVEPRDHLATA